MKIHLSTKPLNQIKLDTLLCPVATPCDKSNLIKELDLLLDNQVSRLIKRHEFREKAFQQLSIPTLGRSSIGRIHLVGVVDDNVQPGFLMRAAVAKAVRATSKGSGSLGIYLSDMNETNLRWATEGLCCGLYRYSLKQENDDFNDDLISSQPDAVRTAQDVIYVEIYYYHYEVMHAPIVEWVFPDPMVVYVRTAMRVGESRVR